MTERKKYVRPVFLVFSDDMNWCRENLNGTDTLCSGTFKKMIDLNTI